MDYRLELLDDAVFEDLVNTICQKLLGTGVIVFAPGKDGGRDGKFTGSAEKYPSETVCWSGKFIIQAKHTANPIASCSDREFEKIVNGEIEKIKELKNSGDIDNYMVFTNRKYSGVKGEALLKKIISETGVNNSVIIGKETINKYLSQHRDIVKQFKLDLHHIPFDFSDDEIKNIIMTFKAQLPQIESDLKAEVERLKYDFNRIKLEDKNAKNKLGATYYENEVLSRSLVEFDKIQKFLENPINEELKNYYFDIAAELSQLITLKRSNFEAFEEIFVYIYKLICDGSIQLQGSKRHVSTFLHYMYFECLIGEK